MKKLADISSFERLQGQMNGTVCDVSVFNGDFTKGGMAYIDNWLSKHPDIYPAKELAKKDGHSKDIILGLASNYIAVQLHGSQKGGDQGYVDKECADLAAAISSAYSVNMSGKDISYRLQFEKPEDGLI